MCMALKTVFNKDQPWKKYEVACGHCWQCKQQRVNNYVGKALCEASTSAWAVAVTLTYAPRTDGADKFLNKHHFQTFMKRVRNDGQKLRYLAAGEYGKNFTQRSHFHCILMGKVGLPPQIPKKENVHWLTWDRGLLADGVYGARARKRLEGALWPHGHVWVDDEISAGAFRYVAKYCLKDHDGWVTQSKRPILGAEFIERLAADYAANGTLPPDLTYRPPGGNEQDKYGFTGGAERLFLETLFRLNPGLKSQAPTEWLANAIRRADLYGRRRSGFVEPMEPPRRTWRNTLDNHVALRLDLVSHQRELWETRKWVDEIKRATGKPQLTQREIERSANRVLMRRWYAEND